MNQIEQSEIKLPMNMKLLLSTCVFDPFNEFIEQAKDMTGRKK